MPLDIETVRRVAQLARIGTAEEELAGLVQEFEAMIGFVDQLAEVDVTGVEPMTSVSAQSLTLREDEVTDGDMQAQVLKNAPDAREGFFAVPKVVE